MSEKVEISGDVAQFIGGNVNEAPRQNNVVNFNMSGNKTPVETLTDLQRKRISGLVKDLCAITQEKPLDVYRVILTEFGAERMKDMPRAKYHEIAALAERWISENTPSSQKTAPKEQATDEAEKLIAGTHSQHCGICREKDISYARLQLVSRGQWILSFVLTAVCGLLFYNMPTQVDASSNGQHYCFYEGKSYSAGSTINGGSGIPRECVVAEGDRIMKWAKP